MKECRIITKEQKEIISKTINALTMKFREIRIRAGETQESLADKMGYDKTIISKIEAGKRALKLDDILRLYFLFNITPNELFGITDNEDNENNENIIDISNMSDELKTAILAIYSYGNKVD